MGKVLPGYFDSMSSLNFILLPVVNPYSYTSPRNSDRLLESVRFFLEPFVECPLIRECPSIRENMVVTFRDQR